MREIARCFLSNAAMTVPGELARVIGISRWEAGLGNRALVEEGFATSPSRGVYVLYSRRGSSAARDLRYRFHAILKCMGSGAMASELLLIADDRPLEVRNEGSNQWQIIRITATTH